MGVHKAHHPVVSARCAARRKAWRHTPCTPAYGASGGQSDGGSPVERAVVDRLTDKEQRRYDAVRAAISETERMKHGHQRMELIDRVY